jgi:hypothetical protein
MDMGNNYLASKARTIQSTSGLMATLLWGHVVHGLDALPCMKPCCQQLASTMLHVDMIAQLLDLAERLRGGS